MSPPDDIVGEALYRSIRDPGVTRAGFQLTIWVNSEGVTFFSSPYNNLGHNFEKNGPWVLAVALTTSLHPERGGM
jgi:hypothetical protein